MPINAHKTAINKTITNHFLLFFIIPPPLFILYFRPLRDKQSAVGHNIRFKIPFF